MKPKYDAGKNLKEQMDAAVALYEENCSLQSIADALNLNPIYWKCRIFSQKVLVIMVCVTTVLNGGISMVIFFFVNKIIFPESGK